MFNLKTHNKTAQAPCEKYLREENVGPKADDNASITENNLTHRKGYEETIVEDHLTESSSNNAQILEKALKEIDSDYIEQQGQQAQLTVPPINVLVEKLRSSRREQRNEKKEAHWSITFNEKRQQGSLPKWNKNAPQHDKVVLNNDPQRFENIPNDPTKINKHQPKPLVGGITTADIDGVVTSVKTGKTQEYDTAIMAILRLAHEESRELTGVEQNTIVNLKTARTRKLLHHVKNS